MLFNSLQFLVFFPIVVAVYFILPKKVKNVWLLVASYYFYMCWNARYAGLIFISTLITWLSGLLMEGVARSTADAACKLRRKKWVVAGSFVINLGILFFFKYFDFTMNALQSVLGAMGIAMHKPAFDVILPVGISFYTFQALSYTMDVYREELPAEKNFFQYALFVSFFPQLVAGPIERSKNLIHQLSEPKKFNIDAAREGLLLMLWGFFLKIVLADRIAIFVDTVYGNYAAFGGWYLVVATVLFAFQIYCDFMGYSTIAMGAAKMLNIQLMENFDAPYLATSVAEFWRRWHISLTSWFKDYLYIPLGGSRKGKARKQLNKLAVFLVSGLWHGAEYSFVVWGLLNGLYQVLGDALRPLREKLCALLHLDRKAWFMRGLSLLCTFLLIDFSWVFFRAATLGDACAILKSIFTADNFHIFADGSIYLCGLDKPNFGMMLLCLFILLYADLYKRRGVAIRHAILQRPLAARWVITVGAVMFLLIFGKYGSAFDAANFIYFQF